MPRIKACLFDMDGLLIDSERIYTETTELFLAAHGKEPVFPPSIKSQMMGRPGPEAAAVFLSWCGLKDKVTIEEYRAEQHAYQESRWPHVKVLPGVLDLIQKLSKAGIPIALATSSTTTNYVLKASNLQDLFSNFGDFVICGDDARVAGKGKPQPDIFIESLKNINLARSVKEQIKPEECLVLEDGVPGVTAGLRAGNHVLWVPDAAILAIHANEVDQILGDKGHMITSLEDFPWSYYGLDHVNS